MTAPTTRGRRAALLLLATLALLGTATSCSKSDSDGSEAVVSEESVEYDAVIEIHDEDAGPTTTITEAKATTTTTKPATTTTEAKVTSTTKANTTTTKPVTPTTTTTAAPTTTTTSTPGTTTTTTTPSGPKLGPIQSATKLEANGAPIDPTDTFDADTPVIYSTSLAASLPKGTVIDGTYTLAGKTISKVSATAKTDQANVYVHFALDAKGDFEAGTYTLQLTIDGKPGPKATFTVS